MKKIISFISELPTLFFVFSPSMCGVLLYQELEPILVMEIVTIIIAPNFVNLIFKPKEEEKEYLIINNNYNIFGFLVLLFIEVLICSFDHNLKLQNNYQYYLPEFIVDFLSPNNSALKLISIIATFLFMVLLHKKAKELFEI